MPKREDKIGCIVDMFTTNILNFDKAAKDEIE